MNRGERQYNLHGRQLFGYRCLVGAAKRREVPIMYSDSIRIQDIPAYCKRRRLLTSLCYDVVPDVGASPLPELSLFRAL